MKLRLLLLIINLITVQCIKIKSNKTEVKNVTEEIRNKTKTFAFKGDHVPKARIPKPEVLTIPVVPILPINHHVPPKITNSRVEKWASKLSKELFDTEAKVVRRDFLLKHFSDVKFEPRDGSAIVNNMANTLEELLERRAQAAEAIMRSAEELSKDKTPPPTDYRFDKSTVLDKIRKDEEGTNKEYPYNCTKLNKVPVNTTFTHFDAQVSLDTSSVHVSQEVFDCDNRIRKDLYWSEKLQATFRKNFARDATMDFQYFCSAKGFMRHYPAALWSSMMKLTLDSLPLEESDVFDCRLRPWYVAASGAPRDVLILMDATGSMNKSSNLVVAEVLTLTLLNTLTDDDQVNVLRFNTKVQAQISCFNDRLVSANHVNTAAMMTAVRTMIPKNETDMQFVLEFAVNLLQTQEANKERPPACQQIIVLLTDSMERNHTELMARLDPDGKIRLFVMWLHDQFGLRDYSRLYSEELSCQRNAYFAELITHADVNEQVLKILQVLQRPLVAQRKDRPRAFSDLHADLEDPRRAEFHWQEKERMEQAYRYRKLRWNKDQLLSPAQLYKDFIYQDSLDSKGYYYEGEDLKYRYKITVSVPVFDHTTVENITKVLFEQKHRNSTRTYPVNRLLGVAGVDIPIEHLKLLLPYHQIGPGGSIFIIDHRGNIVLHEDLRPVFDGDILKPGYRTVDLLDIEQPAILHYPRDYPRDWVEFRQTLVIDPPKGNQSKITMYSKNIYDGGMRATLENREYFYRRVQHHYTTVVALPKNNKHAPNYGENFSQELADACFKSLHETDFDIQPDWLYCRHVDSFFDERKHELLHFIRRRRDEKVFPMKKIQHVFSPIKHIPLLEKPYQCSEGMMTSFCKEAIATEQWAKEHEEQDTERDCSKCFLGPVTAFVATESGLTRWQEYHIIGNEKPPEGNTWNLGSVESWYRRAAAYPDLLVVHAPVTPVRKLRNSFLNPPPLGERAKYLTAARTLGSTKRNMIGVAGYHFLPAQLDIFLQTLINPPSIDCNEKENEEECPPCDGENWSCVLIDEGGWVVSGVKWNPEEPRKHLATTHPVAMQALLTAGAFQLNWVHDYQAVCFQPEDNSAMSLMPTLIFSIWRSVKQLLHLTWKTAVILTVISNTLIYGEAAKKTPEQIERDHEEHLLRTYVREKFDKLYDPRVLINKTRIAACDRSRALYVWQPSKAKEVLKRPADDCTWPLVGAEVPKTNLILLAINNLCPQTGKPVPDPLVNQKVDMTEEALQESEYPIVETEASKLACWRNKVTFPIRQPHIKCYPHVYTNEDGYRQCGPWLPDPKEND